MRTKMELLMKYKIITLLYIDLQPGWAVKIGNAPM